MDDVVVRGRSERLHRTTVRVREETRDLLRDLAEQTHASMQDVLVRALEQYRRQLMIDRANAAYAALREDADAWQEVQRERELFEHALSDGIEDDPYPL